MGFLVLGIQHLKSPGRSSRSLRTMADSYLDRRYITLNLSETDIASLNKRDEDVEPHSWDELKRIIGIASWLGLGVGKRTDQCDT